MGFGSAAAARSRWLAAAVCAVVALGLVACGGSDSNSSSTSGSGGGTTAAGAGVADAKARVEAASGPVRFTFDTPLAGVEQARGKKVFFLANLISLPFVQTQISSLESALGEVGVTVDTGGANGNVGDAEKLLQQAVARKYDAIIINSIPSKLLSNGLKAAKAAGVPVIQQFEGDPHAPSAADSAAGVFGYVTFDYSLAGRLMADWVIQDSDGKATAGGIGSSDAQASVLQMGALEEQFTRECPDCDVKVSDVLIGDWATRLGPVTQTIVRDPNLGYLLPVWDGMGTFVVPAVKQAGAGDRVKIVSSNADEAPMKQLAAGELMAANVGMPLEWTGWATADQTLRALVGETPVADERIPLRLFSTQNIDQIDVDKPQETWYGPTDFRADYRKLWGI